MNAAVNNLYQLPIGGVPEAMPALPVQVLMEMFEQPIHFHPWCAKLTGSAVAGLFLSYALRRTQRLLDPMYFGDEETDAGWAQPVASDNAWFFASVEEVTQETGMSKFEQQTAKRVLRNLTVLEERLSGLPARKEYRVNTPLMMGLLQTFIQHRQERRVHTR